MAAVRRRSRKTLFAVACGLVALWALGTLGGCAWFQPKPELSAEENFERGMVEFEQEDYKDAIPYFEKILENYPFSIHAVPAELKIAECYYYDEKFVEALVHLQGFEELHPLNDQIPYVLWMKANCYFEQFSTIDRDISPLENAKRELNELFLRFPGSAYEEEARPMLVRVNTKLAEHDFYVARFYYQAGDLYAALARFQKILAKYEEPETEARAAYYIGKCYFFLAQQEKARSAFEDLLAYFPDSPYRRHAKMFLDDIEKGRFTIVSRYFRLKERLFRSFGYE